MDTSTSSFKPAEPWEIRARQVARGIRIRVLEHTVQQNGGYLSQACSSAETLATLYVRVMNLGPSQAPLVPPPFLGSPAKDNHDYSTGAAYNGSHAPDRDRFFFSPSHYALALYAALIEVGRMAPEGLAQYNQDGSTVEMIGAEHSPGMEVTSGSLGQTLSQAAGVAMARRLRGDSGRVWVFMSDGEFQSGQTWEALQLIAFHRLDNIGIYVDVNGQQCDGKMQDVMRIESLAARVEAFGARALPLDGHDPSALAAAAELPTDGRAGVVLCYTSPCRGLELLEERRPRLHYVRFKDPAERAWYAEVLTRMQTAVEFSSD